MSKRWLLVLASLALLSPAWAQDDLKDYRTVEKAITAKVEKGTKGKAAPQPAYLGIQVDAGKGQLVVIDIAPDSPAARDGLKKGDALISVSGAPLAKSEGLRDVLRASAPGDKLSFQVRRGDREEEITVTLGATSRPLVVGAQRAILGVKVADATDGVKITDITAGSPAEKLGLMAGDVLLKLAGQPLNSTNRLNDVLFETAPGDKVSLTYRRDKAEPVQKEITLAAERDFGPKVGKGGKGGFDARAMTLFKKDVYRLAVIIVEYPDVKHNDKIKTTDWEESFFTKGTYTNKKSVTGQTVHGSLNDYYNEISYGKLRVEGQVFAPVEVSKKRAEYANMANKTALLAEAVDKLLARDKEDALKDFDGIFFMYAGARLATQRGGLYWPHRATFFHKGKRWAYFICPEGGDTMESISVTAHEFGHMLGLPDLYAQPNTPGAEGLGVWCAMANQIGKGRPQHFSAWCKEQLGWMAPTVIDPTVKQKLILRPVQSGPSECYKVLVRPDGSEYFLLENRTKKGFDGELPGEGLIVWRVADGKPILEESHGVAGPPGPRVFLSAVPYPTKSNDSFTPHTTPSSRSQHGGGAAVHITNIRRLPDGRITFWIGYEFF